MEAPEAAQQHVLGRPPAHAAQFEQTLSHHRIAFSLDGLHIQFPSHDRAGEAEKRTDLLMAEPNCPVLFRLQPRHVVRGEEAVPGVLEAFRISR